jgi:hypothetical protein
MIRHLFVVLCVSLLAACGGGGGSTTLYTPPPPTGPVNNVVPLVVDGGPLSIGGAGVANVAFISVTLCAPKSTTNCQTVDHIQVDTGSVGLRIQAGALNANMLATLPQQTDSLGRPIGECYQYVDGYVWGSVRNADLTLGGETSADMPMQVIGDNFAPPPSACADSGGRPENTVVQFGANGIIGIGITSTDCGLVCAQGQTGSYGYLYYACAGPVNNYACVQTAQGAKPSDPNQQLPNPVATFAQDNNGTLISLPSAPITGQATLNGTLTFGIATQANNQLGSAVVYQAGRDSGYFTTTLAGNTYPASYLDSGTSVLVFNDDQLTPCPSGPFQGYYCQSPPAVVSAVNTGLNAATGTVSVTVGDASQMNFSTNFVLPGLAVTSGTSTTPTASQSVAWGLPFFYGRNVFTAIQGRNAPGGNAPYYAY